MGITSIVPDTMRNIFDHIFCVMLVFDDNGVITYINESGKHCIVNKFWTADLIFALRGKINISPDFLSVSRETV